MRSVKLHKMKTTGQIWKQQNTEKNKQISHTQQTTYISTTQQTSIHQPTIAASFFFFFFILIPMPIVLREILGREFSKFSKIFLAVPCAFPLGNTLWN